MSNLEHSRLFYCIQQFHVGALFAEIYKWAQNDSNDKRTNSAAPSKVDFISVYSPCKVHSLSTDLSSH